MKKIILAFICVCMFALSGHVFAIESSTTYDQQCSTSDPNSEWDGTKGGGNNYDPTDPNAWIGCRCKAGYKGTRNTFCAPIAQGDSYNTIQQMRGQQTDTGITSNSNDNSLFVQPNPNDDSWNTEVLNPKWQNVGFIILLIIFTLWIIKALITFIYAYVEEGKPERDLKRKQRQQDEEERRQWEAFQKEIAQRQREELKAEAWASHEKLLSAIRELPRYKSWRNQVLDKLGHTCGHCGRSDNLEIHHHTSFSSIVKLYGITDTYKAVDCVALWDVDNGSVLCKSCHDEMESSKQRKLLMQDIR